MLKLGFGRLSQPNGAGAFANVKLSSGDFLVKGRRVAGFPNSTELEKPWAKQGALLPFFVESQLKTNGAITINKTHVADKHDVIVDERIVSTMFLPSSALVAKEMILLLNQKKVNKSIPLPHKTSAN